MFHPLIEPLEARIAPATLAITPVNILEGDLGTKNLTFTVTLTEPSDTDVTVHFATADGTGANAAKIADNDYVANAGMLTFLAGDNTPQTIQVLVKGDRKHEVDETFTVTLDSPTGAMLDPQATTATGTIANNDAVPTITITGMPVVEGDSGTQNAVFNVALSNPSSEVVSVVLTTADATAVAGSDYVAKTETFTFNPGDETSKTFTVAVNGDLLDETSESFIVKNLTDAMNAMPGLVQATGFITNDDVRVRVGDVSIVEGNAGDATLTFMVQLSTASNHEVTVNYTTADPNNISATGTPDFDQKMGTLTFPAGVTSQPVSITVHGDLLGELDESFLLTLTAATDATISRGTATGTITNDDATLRISDVEILEGANGATAQAVFTVTLDHGPQNGDVTVDVMTMDGTATLANSDYGQLTPMTLTFAQGEHTKTVTVPVNGDVAAEDNETFKVLLSNPTNATITGDTATGTILNDDGLVFRIDDATITEGDSGTAIMTFVVSRVTGTGAASINLTTVNGTARSDGANPDFDAPITQVVTFPPTATTMTRVINVPIRGDLIHEGTESFTVQLSSTAGVTFTRSTAIGTITDNDPQPAVSIANGTLFEGDDGTSYMTFEATLSRPSSEFVTVSFATADGTGANAAKIADNDYVATSGGMITFAPGLTKMVISIPILGDTADEFDETFGVTLSNPLGATLGTASATGTIQNDEITIIIGDDVTMLEGNNGTITYMFPVSLNQAPVGHPVTVKFATQNDTASTAGSRPDYVARSGTLTFPDGSNAPQMIAVTVNGDPLFEGDERFFVNLFEAANAKIVRGQAIGTITNDDLLIPNATVRISGDVQVLEGGSGSTTQAVFTVTLENGPITGDVIVDLATVDGTATLATNDFGVPSKTTLTFRPGEPTSQTITVPVKGDLDTEQNETFQVQLTGSNATITQASATTTILNDDGAVFTINDVTITEGDNGTVNAVFLVRLLKAPSSEVTVDVMTMDGSATVAGNDYTALPVEPPTTLTFTAGTTQLQQLVQVAIRGDLVKEATETFRVLLSNPTGGATIAKAEGIGTILDNNDPAPVVSIGNMTLAEGDSGTRAMNFTVTLSQPSESAVTVSYSTQDGSGPNGATASSNDYTPVLGGSVTFQPGETTATIPISIIGDTADELDETFGVAIFNPVGAVLGLSNAIGTIQNDEVTISIGPDFEMLEGDSGTTIFTFQVTLSQAPIGHPVMVSFQTENDTAISTGPKADYVAKTGTLTFLAGDNTPQTISIVVNGDIRNEADDKFLVKLLSPLNATIIDGEAVGTIMNNDTPKVSIRDPLPFPESAAGTSKMSFTVVLDKPSDLPVTVRVNTQDGTALASTTDAMNMTTLRDYTSVTDQLVVFQADDMEETVMVEIVDDGDDEPTESFSVVLSEPTDEPTNATLDRVTATGTILDDDARTLTISDASVSEGDADTKFLVFTVKLSQAAKQTVTVDYATLDSSALAGQDYDAASGTITFDPNVISKTISIPIKGDTTVEGNEVFLLRLLNAHNANLAANTQVVGTIVDDESTIKLVPVTSSVNEEGGTGVVQFHVVREGDLSKAVTVQYRTVDSTDPTRHLTATGGADFTPKTGMISFAAGSAADALITIPITTDQNYELNETFQVELFNPINAAVLTNGSKEASGAETVTIVDNDSKPTLSIGNARLDESDAGTKQLVFEVTLSAANERDNEVSVSYATQNGPDLATTARSTETPNFVKDYNPVNGEVLRIPKGALKGEVRINVTNDSRDELDEEFLQVVLSGALGADIPGGTAVATGTIVDDDAAPTLQFIGTSGGTVTVEEGDAGERNATFILHLSAISERPVSVRVTTHDQTAVSAGVRPDFTALHNFKFEYEPGDSQTQINVSIPILGDAVDEADETFTISLSDPEFAQLLSSTGTVKITDDDPSPAITVNDVSVEEGNDGTTDLIFTVSLSAASDQTVKVDFKTGTGGTASATGALADYVAKNGTLKFLPGELSQEVRVKVNGDVFKEGNETLSLELSDAVNGTILTTSGMGTILNDGDTTVGISISNGFRAEGDPASSTLSFTVELSEPLTTATTFRVVATNGTAVSGRDFGGLAGTGTIAANAKSTTVSVTVINDGAFEPTESFFVSLRAVPDGITVVDGKGRGTIFNDDARRVDSHTLQFVDVDGDLVTVRVSEGRLRLSDLVFGPLVPETGGHQLQVIDLVDANGQFQNADVSVNAGKQKGFHGDAQGRMGDGHVNVGYLRAAVAQRDILQVTNGIDLGTVQIDGDLGRIDAGDTFVTPAIQSLELRSFGRLGTRTQAAGATTESLVLGRVENLFIAGSMGGRLDVVGDRFGSIRNLHIGGALLGGDDAASGFIQFTGRLRSGYIGSITGGDGQLSGTILASLGAESSIGNLRVGGVVAGGAGQNSGSILAPVISSLKINGLVGGNGTESGRVFAFGIENLVVTGNVNGGTGIGSGQIEGSSFLNEVKIRGRLRGNDGSGSGTVSSAHGIDKISILGGIFGGSGSRSGRVQAAGAIDLAEIGGLFGAGGERSGTIQSGGGLQVLNVFGNIEGGNGAGSGGIDVGGLLRKGVIDGDIVGGSAGTGVSLLKSGYVIAHRIQKLSVDGDVKAGSNAGTGLALSGTIRAETTIGFLRIHGDLEGNEGTAVIISAAGKGNNQAAIKNLKIDGFARFAEVLAGYGVNATTSNVRGETVNADARIGKVNFGGDVESISVIAGAAAGADGLFGTADDSVLAGADGANAKSRIAKILIEGAARTGTTSAGIIAQFVKSLRIGSSNVALNSGAGNDLDRGKEIAAGSGIAVFELPLPS